MSFFLIASGVYCMQSIILDANASIFLLVSYMMIKSFRKYFDHLHCKKLSLNSGCLHLSLKYGKF